MNNLPGVRPTLALLFSLLLTACENISYYAQAVSGHVALLGRQQNIDRLLAADDTPPELQASLQSVQAIRSFAAEELALPVGRHYSRYAALDRPFVIWNVFASPEFSLQPLQWCFPVAGCVSYRGYFREQGARQFAAQLQASGYDVYVGGVSAYSTLGWFSDPLLSTFLDREEYQLASLLFHELAHQVVYVPGDTVFNESFATAVEQEGLRRWLDYRAFGQQEEIFARVAAEEERRRDFVALVADTIDALETLYNSELDEELMRSHKQLIITDMRRRHEALKLQWGGNAYDNWFRQDINNAQLMTVGTYNHWVPAFQVMLEEAAGNLPDFYAAVQALARLERSERDRQLQQRMPLSG